MDLLSDIITYVRRIIKSPSDVSISDNLIVDYINRFWINDVSARIQLFDLKTKYQFQTVPGVDQYNMPLYSLQISNPLGPNVGDPQDTISYYPVYQGFSDPCYINGVQVSFYTQRSSFFGYYINVVQNLPVVGIGNGTVGPYVLNIPFLSQPATPINPPVNAILRGHVDIEGIIATNTNPPVDPPLSAGAPTSKLNLTIPTTSVFPAVYYTSIAEDGSVIQVCDSGQFLESNRNYGLLMQPGPAPLGNLPLSMGSGPPTPNVYSTSINTINYLNGRANVQFPVAVPSGANISAQCYMFQTGLPRAMLFYDNIITLRSPPDRCYLVEMEAYLSPAAYLSQSSPIQFGYMCEYIARGAARKILSDTGDMEQMMFYEPLFKEQEMLVWKRSQRQFTSTRTNTIYNYGPYQGQSGSGLGSTGM